jgi:hypothetical protein
MEGRLGRERDKYPREGISLECGIDKTGVSIPSNLAIRT